METKKALASIVYEFNTENEDSIVHLVLDAENNVATARFDIEDMFVDDKYYKEGSAVLYLSKEFYETIEGMAKERKFKVCYNNTRSTFWLCD